jgi:hypothetical protein
MQTLTEAYIEALLWSELEEDGTPLDQNYTPADLDPDSRTAIENDCARFQSEAAPILDTLGVPDSQIGHDFLLTRNRHGTGFWDRPEMYGGQDSADKLTDIAHTFGETNAYIGDDGIVYVTGD